MQRTKHIATLDFLQNSMSKHHGKAESLLFRHCEERSSLFGIVSFLRLLRFARNDVYFTRNDVVRQRHGEARSHLFKYEIDCFASLAMTCVSVAMTCTSLVMKVYQYHLNFARGLLLKGCMLGSLLILLSNSPLYAKKVQQHEMSRDWMYYKSNIYITAHPAFSSPPTITSFNNPYQHQVKLSGIMNFNMGFVYMYNFNKNIGLSVGLLNALMSFKSFTFFSKIDGLYLRNLAHTNTGYENGSIDRTSTIVNHATTFPIRIIYRKKVAPKIDLNIQAGLDIQLQPSFLYEYESYTIPDNDSSKLINTSLLSLENMGKKFIVIPYFGFGIGINQLLKNNHYIHYQFSGHIPFLNPYQNGKFSILPNTIYEANGTFKLNPMSFGLEVNYVFTFNRRKLRKERNKNNTHYFNSSKQN